MFRLLLGGALAALIAADARALAVIDGCQIYPANNIWNTPVDANSAAYIDTIGAAVTVHPDFGTVYDGAPNGIPYVTVPGSQPMAPISFTVPQTRNTFVWPGRHQASNLTGAQYPPMGQRFRLKAGVDIDGDNVADALTDGLLVLRRMFGLSGGPLITGAIGANAVRRTAEAVAAYMDGFLPALP